jgi:hypothetical protein
VCIIIGAGIYEIPPTVAASMPGRQGILGIATGSFQAARPGSLVRQNRLARAPSPMTAAVPKTGIMKP